MLEEFGNRVDAAPQEVGQEEEPDDDQRDGRHPFVAGNGQSHIGRRTARHAHELLGRNIGGNQ